MDNKEIDYKRAAEQLRKGEPRPLQNSSYNLPFLNIFVPLYHETEVILSKFC